jgi:hypothetical protein
LTVNELKEEVCALGFEGELSQDMHFLPSANRALKFIHSSLPHTKIARLVAAPRQIGTYIPFYNHTPGGVRSFTLYGQALSFKTSGPGSYRIEDGSRTVEGSFKGGYSKVKAYVGDGSVLTLFGDFSFTVTDITVYKNMLTESAEDIPLFLSYQSYDIKSFAEDYFEVTKPPENIHGCHIRGARVSEGRLYLPEDYCGEVIFYYRAKPKPITENDPYAEIDISPEHEHLLPLLTSAYLWLDDEEEKAQYYMSLYKEEEARLKRRGKGEIGSLYTDVLRWA